MILQQKENETTVNEIDDDLDDWHNFTKQIIYGHFSLMLQIDLELYLCF